MTVAVLLVGRGWAADPEGEEGEPVALPDGKPALVLDAGGHTSTIRKVFFTPDGRQVVTLSADHTVRITDVLTGQPVKVLYPPGFGGLLTGALSPDGKTLAAASRCLEGDKVVHVIYLLDLAQGRVERVLRGHTDGIVALAYSPDGKRLASGSQDRTTRVWDPADGRADRVLKNGLRFGLAFSPDGGRLACVHDSHGEVIDLASGKETDRIEGHRVTWSPDGKTLATTYPRDGIRLWGPDGTVRRHLLAGVPIAAAAFSPDSRRLLATRMYNQKEYDAVLLDAATGEGLRQFGPKRYGVASDGLLSPDGELAAVAGSVGGSHQASVWKTADGTEVGRLAARPWIEALGWRPGWSADGKSVTWHFARWNTGANQSFHLGELQFGPALKEKDFRGPLRQEGAFTLEVDGDRSVRVLKDGQPVAAWKVPATRWVTLLGQGRVAVSSGERGAVTLYDAATGKEIRRLRGHAGPVGAPAPSPDGRFLLTISQDQTLRIWDPDRGNNLLALYVQGNDWVAWTPEGYYAASAGGERLVGWKVDNGIDKMPTYYPASRFHASLYRPDVISRLPSEGSLQKALAAADRARGQKTGVVELTEVLPPEATLTAPGLKDGKVTDARLEVEATARGVGKHPVTALQLLLDGRPYLGGQGLRRVEGAKAGAEVRERWTVELPPGEHTLRVLARSAVSTGLSTGVEVAYARPAPRPRLRVLVVGIDDYQDRNLKLRCAARDARDLEKTFRARSKDIFEVETRVLTDGRATRRGILEDGLAWLKKDMKPQDTAVVFYAGHGVQDGRGFYLLPQDVDVNRLADTGVSGEELKRRLADLPGKVLLLLDACHAGTVGGRAAIGEVARDLADEDCGVVVLCAALGSEKAVEGPELEHGYFCLALIEGLEGKAPRNPRDGCVYFHHLEQYVIDRVGELSKDEQHPTSARPAIRPFALAKP